MVDVNNIIKEWRKLDYNLPPFILDGDDAFLKDKKYSSCLKTYRDFNAYIASKEFCLKHDTTLHVGLLPLPFAGNLKKATIFILMLNPGLSPGDYYAEDRVSLFRKAYIRNLRQENGRDEFPLICLDPRFSWHPGFIYWEKKFHDIIHKVSIQRAYSYQHAMKIVSNKVACLELFPYHSRKFGSSSLLRLLPSVELMRSYAHDVLVPGAKDGRYTIVVARGCKEWKLPRHKRIIVYQGGETRSAHISLSSRGGKAIASHLGLVE